MERSRIPASAIFQAKEWQIKKTKECIREWLATTSFIEFAEEIEKKIIAQPELRRACFIIYKYLESIAYDKSIKSNFILAGPSGCGKTEFYRQIKDYFLQEGHPRIAVSCCDMSSITSAGFKGAEPSDILKGYVNDPASITGFGICFLDEADKRLLPIYAGSGGKTSNVSREVQNGLLKIVEGADITLLSRETVNTSKLCFVLMGSFNDFRQNGTDEYDNAHIMGFNRDTERAEIEMRERAALFRTITKEDIIKGGGTIELLGRFSQVINFRPMSAEFLDALIEKVRKDVAESFPFLDIQLMPDMIDYLKTQANTEFGVRYLDELIRGAVITASIDFYTSKLCAEMGRDEMLVITLYDQDGYSYHIRKMTEEESEYYNKFRPDDKEEYEEIG